PRGAGAVVDDHLLLERLGELRAENAREQVRRAARRRGRKEPDRPAWIVLRLRRKRGGQHQGGKERFSQGIHAPDFARPWSRTGGPEGCRAAQISKRRLAGNRRAVEQAPVRGLD